MTTGITIERTSIRSTPNGDIVRSLPAGMSLTFTADLGSWLHVYSADGRPQGGYVNARSVKITSEVATPPPVDPQLPPAVTPSGAVHSILVRADGKINIDGLGYE